MCVCVCVCVCACVRACVRACVCDHLRRVNDLELPVSLVSPLDARLALSVCQQLQQKLPQLDLRASAELNLWGRWSAWRDVVKTYMSTIIYSCVTLGILSNAVGC